MTQRDDSPSVNLRTDEITRQFDLDDRMAGILAESCDMQGVLSAMIERGLSGQALRVFPYVVPIRTAVWWALLCCWHGLNGVPSLDDERSLRRVFDWIVAPTAEHRRRLLELHEADRLDTAVDCCVKAACFAGGWDDTGTRWEADSLSAAARLCVGSAAYVQWTASTQELLEIGILAVQGKLPWTRDAISNR